MPELPEVETIARGLRQVLVGHSIRQVRLPGPHAVSPQGTEVFVSRVAGAGIRDVGRRGKLLLLHLHSPALNAPLTLAVHLRMTGRLFLPASGPGTECPHDIVDSPHTHALFELEGVKAPLVFHDVRKFGRLLALREEELASWPFWAGLGPEPLELGAAEFLRLFNRRRGRVKALLLDQKVIAGVGNIYADESLFRAGIRPDAHADRIPEKRLKRLHASLQEVLQEAIAACGSSISDYRTSSGDAGAFQNSFRVYGRGGQCCTCCEARLQKLVVASRTSVFCPCCQK